MSRLNNACDDAFDEHLRKHARDLAMIDRALERLPPYRDRARCERYPLVGETKADKEEIRSAINAVVPDEWRAASIELVSGRNPFPRPVWQSKHYHRESLRQVLRTSLGDQIRAKADNRPTGAVAGDLERALRESFGDRLSGAVGQSYPMISRLDGDECLRYGLRDNAVAALSSYLGLAAAGDAENAVQLEPLVDVMLRAYPLGPLRCDPGIWLVLVD